MVENLGGTIVKYGIIIGVLCLYGVAGAASFAVGAAGIGIGAMLLGFGTAASQTMFIGVLGVGAVLGIVMGAIHLLLFREGW